MYRWVHILAATVLFVSCLAETCLARGLSEAQRGEAERHYEAGQQLLASGGLEEAILHFREALAIDGKHAPALVGIGTARLQQGDLDAAEKAFMTARKKQRKYAPAHNGLGLVYLKREKGLQ